MTDQLCLSQNVVQITFFSTGGDILLATACMVFHPLATNKFSNY